MEIWQVNRRGRLLLWVLFPVLAGCAFFGSPQKCSPQQGCWSSVVVRGTVRAGAGSPIVGARVAAGGVAVETNEEGQYQLTLERVTGAIPIDVRAAGYAPTIRVVIPREGAFHYQADVSVVPAIRRSFAASAGTTLSVTLEGRTVEIRVPPNAFNESEVTLSVGAYETANGPGRLRNAESALQSGGMFHIEFLDAFGDPVEPDPGDSIEVEFPDLALPQVDDPGPLLSWRLGGDGLWGSPSEPVPSVAGYVVPAAPGYWNVDRTYRTACAIGRITSSTVNCSGLAVRADGIDGLSSQDTTDGAGNFCVEGAASLTSVLHVGASSFQVPMPPTPGTCSQPASCRAIGDLAVPSSDCPGGCPFGQIDTPDGCAEPGGGGGIFCSDWEDCGCGLQIRSCGGDSCYYEFGDGTRFEWDCETEASLEAAADAAVQYCTDNGCAFSPARGMRERFVRDAMRAREQS